jgi:hypothetical protein
MSKTLMDIKIPNVPVFYMALVLNDFDGGKSIGPSNGPQNGFDCIKIIMSRAI